MVSTTEARCAWLYGREKAWGKPDWRRRLGYRLLGATGDNRPQPLVYAALSHLYIALSAVDVLAPTAGGAAIPGIARQAVTAVPASRA